MGNNVHEAGREVGRNGPKPAGRPNPFRGPVVPPFDLDAPRTIYSSPAKSHTSIHSPFATEEQRREGHHLGEGRVELIV
jgi:hypothetical protein